jgi:hypothetical protein
MSVDSTQCLLDAVIGIVAIVNEFRGRRFQLGMVGSEGATFLYGVDRIDRLKKPAGQGAASAHLTII